MLIIRGIQDNTVVIPLTHLHIRASAALMCSGNHTTAQSPSYGEGLKRWVGAGVEEAAGGCAPAFPSGVLGAAQDVLERAPEKWERKGEVLNRDHRL